MHVRICHLILNTKVRSFSGGEFDQVNFVTVSVN